MKADIISGAMAAEAALAKNAGESYEETLDSLPEDHPLKVVATEQKKFSGDLSNLPPGHPVLVAMEEARLRYEAEQEVLAEAASVQTKDNQQHEIRKAKRLDQRKVARTSRIKEEEETDRRRAASKQINSSMTEAMDTLKRLNDNIAASQEDFAGDHYSIMKLERLSRVLIATMRGISESKLIPGRVTNG